jgi:outer membrane biosynthesis protein TonB
MQHKIKAISLSSRITGIGMYLAGILGLWALLHVPAWGHVGSESSSFAPINDTVAAVQSQEPDQSNPPAAGTSKPDPSKKGSVPPVPQDPAQPEASAPQTSNSVPPNAAASKPQDQNEKPPAPSKKHKTKKKPSTTSDQGPQKKVIHRGSTAEPTTQLTPGITEEQAVQQRQNTNQLLASTDASLQKLSGRQLNKDEQETVIQIRKFMEQVKAADAAGDLQRAYKLAVKAHLLSDALVNPSSP